MLAVSGAPGSQLDTGTDFVDQAIAEAVRLGYSNFDVTYTGQCLGGFLAQAVSAEGLSMKGVEDRQVYCPYIHFDCGASISGDLGPLGPGHVHPVASDKK